VPRCHNVINVFPRTRRCCAFFYILQDVEIREVYATKFCVYFLSPSLQPNCNLQPPPFPCRYLAQAVIRGLLLRRFRFISEEGGRTCGGVGGSG